MNSQCLTDASRPLAGRGFRLAVFFALSSCAGLPLLDATWTWTGAYSGYCWSAAANWEIPPSRATKRKQ